ncbi:hypothetical protein [Cupriavidus pampae]|uniref:hypothetical protein n=1 Tax=Cupriavidus pampae TaxID=659251 RepID=UPI001CC38CF5|nr:hypothetical protein [Cupriavidus pampae]
MTLNHDAERNKKHIEAFFDWARQLEMEAMNDARWQWMSSWYESRLFVCYTRIGLPPENRNHGHPRQPTICLANIHVSELKNRGRGFFTAMINDLVCGVDGLSYSRIECEEVVNPRLRVWLAQRGFRSYEDDPRSYYLDIVRSSATRA